MTHWRRPHYVIETEHGMIYSANEDDAELIATELRRNPDPVKFTVRRERVPGHVYIPLMVLAVSVLIVGLRYLFGG